MDRLLKEQVEKILSTDEERTNDELFDYFVNELNLAKDLAKKCILQRGAALSEPSDFKLRLK